MATPIVTAEPPSSHDERIQLGKGAARKQRQRGYSNISTKRAEMSLTSRRQRTRRGLRRSERNHVHDQALARRALASG